MHFRGLAAAFVLAPALLFGQLGSGTVTVTASQSSNPQPDQAIFSVTVGSGISQSLGTIVTALAPVGISEANFTGLSYESSADQSGLRIQLPPLSWTFQLTVPLAQIKNTTAALTALVGTIAQNNSGLTLSFYLQGTQVSPQLMQNCDFGNLMNSARAEAQNIASASGFTTGAVVGLAQSIPGCSLTVVFGLPVARTGPNTITISASRTTNPLPDQVLIQMDVTSAATAGLDDINAALAAAGITGATLTGVNSEATACSLCAQASSVLDWSFTLAAPLAKLPSTLTQLAAAEQTVTKQNPALTFSFGILNLQTSLQAQPVCQEAGLVSDARTQAQTIAAAAGVGVGAILNMSDQANLYTIAAYVSGDFAISPVGTLGFTALASNPTSTCSISVQFQLL